MTMAETVETAKAKEKKGKERKGAPRNIYLKSISRAMLENRYIEEGDFAENNEDGFSVRYNESYVYEKFRRDFIEGLEIKTREELDHFIDKVWLYIGKEGERLITKKVDDIIQSVLDDPDALAILRRRLERITNVNTALKEVNQDEQSNGNSQSKEEESLPM